MGKELGEHGYSKEEEYFFKKNKELLEKKRSELDDRRAQQATGASRNTHWMKCPKCGQDLEEVDLAGIKVDQCTQCLGMFFDKGELELLLDSQEQKSFLGGVRRLFKK